MKQFRSIYLLFLLILCGAAFLASIGSAETLVAFGDSLTEGCGTPGDYFWGCGWENKYPTYPTYLQLFFEEPAWQNYSILVRNFGKGGETTDQGVNRLDGVLADSCLSAIDYVLLLEGTNDLFFHHSVATIRFNLGVMIDKVRTKGAVPLLATITPDLEPDHSYKDIAGLNDAIRSLAVEKNVILVDLDYFLAPKWYQYTHPAGCYNDQLHPNSAGFRAIASVWYWSLEELLQRQVVTTPWMMLLLKNP